MADFAATSVIKRAFIEPPLGGNAHTGLLGEVYFALIIFL
jgi:hypothetical protein